MAADPMPVEPARQATRDDPSAQFLAHRHELMAFLMSLDPDPVLAEDILQETWLALAAELRLGRSIDNIPAWSRTVARRAWIRHRRAARRERPDDQAIARLLDRAFAAAPRGPELWAEHLSALRNCMQRLSEAARALLGGRYVEGLTVGELARRTSVNEAAVLMRLSRVRAGLRTCIERRVGVAGAGDAD